MRCLGAARFDVYGALRAVCLRKYVGRLSYLPAAPGERAGANWRATGAAKDDDGDGDARAAAASASSSALPAITALVPFGRPPPLSWRSVEGVFTLLYVTNTSHQSIGVCAAPGARHDDGVFTVTYVQEAGPCAMVPLLLGLDDAGSYVAAQRGVVHAHPALAFRLEPDATRGHQGHISLDGEPVRYGAIQAELHPRLLRIYGPP